MLRAARAFVRAGWAERAARFGWGECALFGVHPSPPWARLDCLGVALLSHRPVAIDRDAIAFAAHDGRRLTRWTGVEDLSLLSAEELRRRADDLFASFPAEIRQALAPFRQSGDLQGECAELKRLVGASGGPHPDPS